MGYVAKGHRVPLPCCGALALISSAAVRVGPVRSGPGVVKAQDGDGFAALQHNAAVVAHAPTTWNAV